MSMIRVKKERGYVVLDNKLAQDDRLSFGARGLMAYLLSKPDNWEVRMSDLENQSGAKMKAIRSLMRELIATGYIERTRNHVNGRFLWEYVVHERPQQIQSTPCVSVVNVPIQDVSIREVPIYKELNRQSTEIQSTEREKSARAENPQPEIENERRGFHSGQDDPRYHTPHFLALCEVCDIDPDSLGYAPQERMRVAGYAVGLSEKYTVEQMKLARSRWPFATAPSPKQFVIDIKKYLNAKENTNGKQSRDDERAKKDATLERLKREAAAEIAAAAQSEQRNGNGVLRTSEVDGRPLSAHRADVGYAFTDPR